MLLFSILNNIFFFLRALRLTNALQQVGLTEVNNLLFVVQLLVLSFGRRSADFPTCCNASP
jgi:hypothetical protein